jgi:hypothetical protein
MDRRYLIVVFWAACSLAHAECASVEILNPPRGSTLHDARPEIRWSEVTGAKAYRVQIEGRVPEGQVVERIDARVGGTRFVPPRPLAERRAAVKLLVTPDCAESASIATRPAWFFIDMAPKCSAIQGLSLSGEGEPRAQWVRSSGATRYEIEIYAVSDGRSIARRETTINSTELPRAATPLIVSVRPRCESVVGEAAYGFLPASR